MFRGRAEEFSTELASFSESFAKQCRGLSNGLQYIPLMLSVELVAYTGATNSTQSSPSSGRHLRCHMFRKQTPHHAASCTQSRFWPSPVRNFQLESTWIFRPLGCFDHACAPSRAQAWYCHSCDGASGCRLMWLDALGASGFDPRCSRSCNKANTASCSIVSKIASGLLTCEIFISRQLGSEGLS